MDIKTLVLVLALGNLGLGGALLLFDHGRAPFKPSPWALAKCAQALAWLLIYWRGVLPDWLAFALADALLFAGLALDAGALWEAAGRGGWRRPMAPAVAAAGALFFGFYLFEAGQTLRAAAASLLIGAFFASGVAALARSWRGAGVSALRRCLVLCMAALAALMLVRGVLLAMPHGPAWPAWLDAAALRVAGPVALYLMMLANGFGHLLLWRETLQRELDRLEVVDGLTDVPNRRGFYQALAPWMALARRPGMPTAMIVLNLDHFKRINDSYGHPVGDAVLKSIVEVCRRQLRDSDLMGRLGGAEFAIQLPRTALVDALLVAERIRDAVARMPIKTERAVINLTASLGVTTIRAEDSTVSLFQRADEALRAAKAGGRNRVAEAAPASALEA